MSKITDRQFNQAKQPSEEIPCGIDFATDLASGETISSFTVSAVELPDNTDVTATITDQATKNINGSEVSVRVRGGEDGKNYKITFLSTTSSVNKYEADVILKVKEL